MKILLLLAMALATSAQSIDLSGSWRFQEGDDPRWAAPDLDDRAWPVINLPLEERRFGSFWLRRTIPAIPTMEQPALALGNFAAYYRVFVNGQLAAIAETEEGQSPQVHQPRAFALAPELLARRSPIVIALRVQQKFRMERGSPFGLLRDRGPYLLTTLSNARNAAQLQLLARQHAMMPTVLTAFCQFLFGLLLFLFWAIAVRRPELLYFSLFLLGASAFSTVLIRVVYTGYYGITLLFATLTAAYIFLSLSFAILFGRRSWQWTALAAAAATFVVGSGIGPGVAVILVPMGCWAIAALFGGDRERRFLAIPVLILVAVNINPGVGLYLDGWPIPSQFYIDPFQFTIASLFSAGFGVLVAIWLVWRTGADRREQYRLAAELQAARAVQQMLLTPAADNPTYSLDVGYLPAAEVGGDFYITLPEAGESGCTVVVGDVSGKGLKAAMVVSLITGALRNRKASEPAALLRELNQVVAGGMDGGFVTATAARLGADGRFRLASAGHPAPYLNGNEIGLDAGLPLGIAGDAEYSESEGVISAGEQMTFVSDGVVEAENANRELFGFDRTREISGQSAAEIAEAAKAWGQNDDITVVTVRRIA